MTRYEPSQKTTSRHLSRTARHSLVFSPSLYSAVSPLSLSMSYPPPPSRFCVMLWRFFPAERLISYQPLRSVWKTSWHPSVPVLSTLTFHLLLSFFFLPNFCLPGLKFIALSGILMRCCGNEVRRLTLHFNLNLIDVCLCMSWGNKSWWMSTLCTWSGLRYWTVHLYSNHEPACEAYTLYEQRM